MRHIWLVFLAVFLVSCAASEPGTFDGGQKPVDEAPTIGELGGMCGGIAGFQCKAEGSYCKMKPGLCVDTADAAGVCAKTPELCTMQYEPVCGCDGKTYGNACSAAGKGVSVAYDGECKSED
ncbi:MAG: hypothetical protein DHS20C05_22730 [Hyphococcus sp.]|nr:MAG: hypothetical protein DHS20C05_22730 [Marinicaulis sp.]